MNAPYAEEFGSGGPSDDGVGVALWRLSQRLDAARERHVDDARDGAVGPVLRALLDGAVDPGASRERQLQA